MSDSAARMVTLEDDLTALSKTIKETARRLGRLTRRATQILEAIADEQTPEAQPKFW